MGNRVKPNQVGENALKDLYFDAIIRNKFMREGKVETFELSRFKALICRILDQEDLPLENIWRVEIRDNHKLKLTDFTMPSSSRILTKEVEPDEAPKFIRDGLAILQIANDQTLVNSVGKRISSSVFYIVEREDSDGIDPRKESERCSQKDT